MNELRPILASIFACLGVWHLISGWPARGSDVRQSTIGKIDRGGESQQGEVVVVRDGVVLRVFTFTETKD